MQFWKMNGAGNDFIVVDDRQNAVPDEKWPEIIRTVCERHMSIGADGFMVVKNPTYGGDYKMLFFNSDGSMGSITWAEELSVMLFIVSIFIGAIGGTRRNQHMRLEMFVDLFRPKTKAVLKIISDLVFIIVAAVLIYAVCINIQNLFIYGMKININRKKSDNIERSAVFYNPLLPKLLPNDAQGLFYFP